MSDLTFEERNRLESEVLPAVVDDPECAALTIVILEKQLAEARMRQTELEKEVAALEERLRMAPDETGDVCPECGGRFVPESEKVLPQRAQSAQRENGE